MYAYLMCESIPAMSNPPGETPGFCKIGQMPGPVDNFCWQIPRSCSNYDSQIPGPPVQPTNIKNYSLPFFNKNNCFNSIELHKAGHEMSHSNWTKTKQMVLLHL